MRKKIGSLEELEAQIGVVRNDAIGNRIGRIYSPQQIEKIEKKRIPWLRAERHRRSS
ncbi:MAG: hypothetical protein MN733_40890 [Nitrososphaera sp.]|nr:hypothetical protein [Nitrososphaera sp.]